ncbi:glycine betaine/L-proline ABC transporter ATP-binding protein [Roseovarius spongiae]|uniref:Quaternary amine transport ATP-binding protein n=1 Tax=Roseovarius spongiae TaxID=2320272 RepID=A0A3A8ARC6_9RHOB|nr:glycine betaine/L-proline ABC transporter ATP-binding protein [Roseovarius spongiae]RKF12576.1 glycine betaine/L-proline ABC transporter ATP-binding protein [Roseovarius spongiae]
MTDRIEIRNLFKIFGKHPEDSLRRLREGATKETLLAETGSVLGVDNVSLNVPKGSISVIMGLSGSGKSTLARCVNRILEPDGGQILLDGEDITCCSPDQMREIRRHRISMVFQNFGLLPNKTVIENVGFGLKLRGMSERERQRKAEEMLEVVGLSAWGSHLPASLSGGMRQRVGLARALATEADVLIMDEAFSALDPLIRSEMQDELLRLQTRLHKTVLFITHDFQEALRLGTRIAIMADGALIREGAPQEIVEDPRSEYVAGFTRGVDRARLFDAQSIMRTDERDGFRLDKKGRVESWRKEGGPSMDFMTVNLEDKLIEIARRARSGRPIAVIDDTGRFCGHIPQDALLAGIAGAGDATPKSETKEPVA